MGADVETNGWRSDTQGATENLNKASCIVLDALPGSDYAPGAHVLLTADGVIYENVSVTYETPSWTARTSSAGQPYDTVIKLSVTIGDYTSPANAVANSVDYGTITFSDDGTSYADQTAYDAAWVTNATGIIRGDPTNDRINIANNNNTEAICYNDRTSVNDTKWLYRFKFVVTAQTTTSNGASSMTYFTIGSTTGAIASAEDSLGLVYQWHNGGSGVGFYSYINNGGSAAQGDKINVSGVGTYYIQVTRLSATSLEIKIFSDADYLVQVGSVTTVITSSYSGLRYLKLHSRNTTGSNGSLTAYVDDFVFYDNYTDTFTAAKSFNDSTSDYWKSLSIANPAIYWDFSSARDHVAVAIALHTASISGITHVKLRFSTDTTFSDGETVRYLPVSDFTNDTYRFILINRLAANARYMQIYGDGTGVLAVTEVKSRYGLSDAVMFRDHNHEKLNTLSVHDGVDSN